LFYPFFTTKNNNMSSIFEKRNQLRPFEYPEMQDFREAIYHSFWTHDEVNFTKDINDYKSIMSDSERNLTKRCLLAIWQIENSVRSFWGNIWDMLPKPEIEAVWACFASNEVIHMLSYSHLLDILWLEEEFNKLNEHKELWDRHEYLSQITKFTDRKSFVKALIQFGLLTEWTALFSQFYSLIAINKRTWLLQWVQNIIKYTATEENLHGTAALHLVKLIKEENESLFDTDEIMIILEKAYDAEIKVIERMYEWVDADYISKEETIRFLKHRFNNAATSIGLPNMFTEESIEEFDFFYEVIEMTTHVDFFVKRSTEYTKSDTPFTSEDLF